MNCSIRVIRVYRNRFLLASIVAAGILSAGHVSALTIKPTFTANFTNNFGGNATAAANAWLAAAGVFTSTFNDPVTINITVDAVSGTGTFGASSSSIVSDTWADLRAKMVADAKSADDNTAISAGSLTLADPSGGNGTWYVTRAEAKAIGLIASDNSTDGSTTFGAGNLFTFSGAIAAGTYDFQGLAAHEISEVLGRIGMSGKVSGGATNFTLIDAFSYTGANSRGMTPGPNESFSIDNGTNLLKAYNNPLTNSLDSRDWANGTDDAFNQFSRSNVVNAVTGVDIRELDVIGYDLVPEPTATALLITAGGTCIYLRRRRRA